MFQREIFRTRVAGRILTLFFVGAIVPVVLLGTLSFRAVSRQLTEQSEAELAQLIDGTAQIMLHQLIAAAAWAGAVEDLLVSRPAGSPPPSLIPSVEGVAVEEGGVRLAVVGSVGAADPLSEAERTRLAGGDPVLRIVRHPSGNDVRLAVPSASTARVAWVDLVADSLWQAALVLGSDPRVEDLCVIDAESQPLVCKTGEGSRLPRVVPSPSERTGVAGVAEVETQSGTGVAAWRTVYLRSAFGSPEWVIVASESSESVYAPVASFAYNLPLALGVGLGLVLLLANFLVRRTMEPLVRLSAGTEKIASHDLTARVEIGSDDEFGELASSFNSMAHRLSRQFSLIEAAAGIDRAVIEESDATAAARALMDGIGVLLVVRRAALLMVDTDLDGLSILFQWSSGRMSVAGEPVGVTERDLPWLRESRPYRIVTPNRVPGVFAPADVGREGGQVLIAPLVVQRSFIGAVALEGAAAARWAEGDLKQALQLVHQAAVALNELRLRRETAEMGWEALRALAVAIDAKSKWTGGHSERVSELARALARRLELSTEHRDLLHRGGLLHDIGKIGVATEVLDHAGKLDDAMRRAIEAHPAIGARILEPMRAFRPLIPIVRHHHERWDGKGYPDRLAGEDIPYLARILTVVDVFDAMQSPRPYRAALSEDFVLEHIVAGAGSAFDPDLIDPFVGMVKGGWTFDRRPGAHVG